MKSLKIVQTLVQTIVYFIVLFGYQVSAQKHPKIDSILNSSITVEEKIDLLTEEVSKSRYDPQTLPFAKKAVELAVESNNPFNLATSHNTLGDYYYFNSKMDSSMLALKIAKKNVLKIDKPFILWSIMVTMGDVKSKENQLIESISLYLESLDILEKVDEKSLSDFQKIRLKGVTMVSLNQLSNLYRKLENYDQALFYNSKAHDIALNKIDDTESASVILNNKGEILYSMERYKEALTTGIQAKQLKIEAKMPSRLIVSSELNIGSALFQLDSLDSALSRFDSAIVHARKLDNKPLLSRGLSQRGKVYLAKGLVEKAFVNCNEAKKITDKIKEPEIKLEACHCLYKVNLILGKHKESLEHYTAYSELKDSIFNEKNIQKTTQLGLQYEFDKKETAQRLESEKKIRHRNLALASASTFGLFTLLGFLVYRKRQNYRTRIAEQEAILKDEQILKLQQENRLNAMDSMIAGQEKERTRIAKDLHDGLGGLLSSIKSHYSATVENKNSPKTIEKTKTLIDNACSEVRRISHNMMPHALVVSGLKDGLKDICESLQVEGFNATLEINPLPEIDKTKQVMVYRLVQEIVTNVKKHAEARKIFIQLFSHNNEVFLTIEDDGIGFDVEKAKTKKGLGIENIESRVAYLNGTIIWDSEEHKGTTINIRFAA